eukprot:269002-Rhodomonas_salina.1
MTKHTKTHTECNVYQHCVFLFLISGFGFQVGVLSPVFALAPGRSARQTWTCRQCQPASVRTGAATVLAGKERIQARTRGPDPAQVRARGSQAPGPSRAP